MAKEEKMAISRSDSLRQANRQSGTKPRSPFSDYAGTYENLLYGKLTIIESDEGLEMKWGNFETSLIHWHYDTFSSGELYPEYEPLITFDFDSSGQVKNVQIGDFWEFEKLKED